MENKNQIVEDALGKYQNVSLKELDSYYLLSRYDTKFVMDITKLPILLEILYNRYNILEIGDNRTFQYDNIYFDTLNKDFYLHHHNNKLSRYKMRYRHYMTSNDTYFEIKEKGNKGKTHKQRYKIDTYSPEIITSVKNFINENIENPPEKLLPSLNVNYNRITLLNKSEREKITFDRNVTFNANGKAFNSNGLVIIERKSIKPDYSEFENTVTKLSAQKLRISKYCLGTILTDENIKRNRFKTKLLTINKVCNGHFFNS